MRPLQSADRIIARWMSRYGAASARVSLGIVFIWFGVLKLLGCSPAAALIAQLVADVVDPAAFCKVLGGWEVAIGVCLARGGHRATRLGLVLMFAQMPGTFLPVLFLPDIVFAQFPVALTLEGQYIAKNLVLISAGLVVGGSLYRSPAIPDPRWRPQGQTHG